MSDTPRKSQALYCPIHDCPLEVAGGCSAHITNWDCPICEAPAVTPEEKAARTAAKVESFIEQARRMQRYKQSM